MLYSFQGARPEPLPFRITLPGGFTRTDPTTFTSDELQAAGFTGPYHEPPYDSATEQLDWVGGAFVVIPKQPEPVSPQVDLKEVATAMISAAATNDADTLATLLADLLDIAQ